MIQLFRETLLNNPQEQDVNILAEKLVKALEVSGVTQVSVNYSTSYITQDTEYAKHEAWAQSIKAKGEPL